MAKRIDPKKLRAAVASAYAVYKRGQRQLDADAARAIARDDDDTPEEVVDALNAGLLARYDRETGRR